MKSWEDRITEAALDWVTLMACLFFLSLAVALALMYRPDALPMVIFVGTPLALFAYFGMRRLRNSDKGPPDKAGGQ
jgi:hypothetical protein